MEIISGIDNELKNDNKKVLSTQKALYINNKSFKNDICNPNNKCSIYYFYSTWTKKTFLSIKI